MSKESVMEDQTVPHGKLGTPPEKTGEKWECPMLCGKTYKTGTKFATIDAHLDSHAPVAGE